MSALLALLLATGPLPTEAKARVQNVEQHLSDWDVEGAKVDLEALRALSPAAATLALLDGRVALEEGRYDDAVKFFEAAEIDDEPQSWLRLAKDTRAVTAGHLKAESAHFIVFYPKGKDEILVPWALETLEKRAAELRALVPEADVRVGHGQMRERELERLMLDFYHRRFNLLVCTTIIESGIDVPTANTMIIDRADRFGLAQLHQLRGRVGRSHHRAFAYLIAPPKAGLSGDAAKRLEAIESLEDLGAGFALATQDLEIRGAGELLGDEQSGQITEIGFSLYLDLLERAIKALRSGVEPDLEAPLHSGPEVNLHVAALIPEEYMPDVHLRLVLYKRIAAAADDEALDELAAEMVDRFGPLPMPIDNLVRVTRLKLVAAALGLKRFDVGPHGGLVEFATDHRVDPAAVLKLVQKETRTYRLDGPNRLRHSLKGDLPEARFKLAGQLLAALGAGSSGKLGR